MEPISHEDEKLKEVRVRNSLWQMTKTQLVEKVREVQKRNEILEEANAQLHNKLKDYTDREGAEWVKDRDGDIRCSKCHRKAPKENTYLWGMQFKLTKYCMHCGSVMREAK